MTTLSERNQNLDRIKALLLRDELSRLEEVEKVALRVDEFVGDRARLAAALPDVLVDALRTADISRRPELASVLAPAVIATLREELGKSGEPPRPARKTPFVLLGVLFVAGAVWAATNLTNLRRPPDPAAPTQAQAHSRPDHSARGESPSGIAQLRSQLAETRSALEDMRRQANSESAKLQRFIDNFAVFFTSDDAFVNPEAVRAGLDELAGLLKSTGEKLRVVGYAEEVGAVGAKSAASRRRVEKVVAILVEGGVPRENLAAVARGRLVPISDFSIGASRSRRVVFERPYQGEFDLVE
jgi:outer membrane protein OmpA-like peptidoglycan-associated protein